MNTVALCAVSEYRKAGKEFDVNGNQNVFLKPLSGKMPNKCMVMAGTVAINNKIEIGSSYVFAFDEKEISAEHGRQFNTQKIKEVSAFELMETVAKLGAATVIDVTTNATTAKDEAFETAALASEFAKR